jgi:hypothetical protein
MKGYKIEPIPSEFKAFLCDYLHWSSETIYNYEIQGRIKIVNKEAFDKSGIKKLSEMYPKCFLWVCRPPEYRTGYWLTQTEEL